MDVNQDNSANTEVFKLKPIDVNHLFRRSGLSGNKLSPFQYNAEQAAASTPSEYFKALAESSGFRQIAEALLEPDIKIEFNRGGAGSADEEYYVLLTGTEPVVSALFVNSEGDFLVLLFEDWASYLDWWVQIYASTGVDAYQAVFPRVMETEVLVCALHCIDIYRRAYMESMLEYSGDLNLYLSMQDYLGLLKRAVASRDKRWLLPTLFELTPGLKGSGVALKPEHIKQLQELGFAADNEGIVTLGERSRLMGTEFITTWMGGLGFQATALIRGEERSLSRVFLTSTAFANHLISFETGSGGEGRFRHQAITEEGLKQTLLKWMEALQKAVGNLAAGRTAAPEAVAVDRGTGPKKQFCGQCGAQLLPGKKFCGQCGTAV